MKEKAAAEKAEAQPMSLAEQTKALIKEAIAFNADEVTLEAHQVEYDRKWCVSLKVRKHKLCESKEVKP